MSGQAEKLSRGALGRVIILAGLFGFAACSTTPLENSVSIDPAQGSQSNIESLTAVVDSNPNSAEAYNVRGTSFGQAGSNKEALADFSKDIQRDPKFKQA